MGLEGRYARGLKRSEYQRLRERARPGLPEKVEEVAFLDPC